MRGSPRAGEYNVSIFSVPDLVFGLKRLKRRRQLLVFKKKKKKGLGGYSSDKEHIRYTDVSSRKRFFAREVTRHILGDTANLTVELE
jgi:hypothetical protein